jgi:hypothetical protein
MASSKGGFENTSGRAKKHAALVKSINRKRNLDRTSKKRGSTNG